MNYFKIATEEAINSFFEWCFTGGHGAQDGIPGKEWTTMNIVPLESVAWRNIGHRSSVSKLSGSYVEQSLKYFKRYKSYYSNPKDLEKSKIGYQNNSKVGAKKVGETASANSPKSRKARTSKGDNLKRRSKLSTRKTKAESTEKCMDGEYEDHESGDVTRNNRQK